MKRTRMQHAWPCALAVALATAALALPGTARAVGLGGTLGYSSPEDLDGTAALGIHAEIERSGTHLHLLPNLRHWTVDGVRDVNPNFDVSYHFMPENRWTPYVGGGLGLNFVRRNRLDESNTDVGLNLMGGVRFPSSSRHYILEGRYTASDVNQVSLLTGVTFGAR